MKLQVKTKNNNGHKPSELKHITTDGWVVGDTAYGDIWEDCEILLDFAIKDKLRQLRKSLRMRQEDMASILNISRPTYASIEAGKRELTLMEYLIIKKIKKDEEIVVDF